MKSTLLLIILICSVLPTVSSAQVKPVDKCTDEFLTLWNFIDQQAAGAWYAESKPPLGDPAATRFLKSNWFPIDGTKQVACGTLLSWTIYKITEPFEMDLHPHLLISPDFEYLLKEVKDFAKPQSSGELYGEVTPPEDFRKEFYGSSDFGGLVGECICGKEDCCDIKDYEFNNQIFCVYGPWISDNSHQMRPEIHPAKLMWGVNAKDADAGKLTLFLITDSSKRFDKKRHFHGDFEEGWQPWNEVPKDNNAIGNFYISYKIPNHLNSGVLSIEEKNDTPTHPQSVLFGGKQVTVSTSAGIKVHPGSVCTHGTDLIGYFNVEVEGVSGYRILEVTKGDLVKPRPVLKLEDRDFSYEEEKLYPKLELDSIYDYPSPPRPLVPAKDWPKTKDEMKIGKNEEIMWKRKLRSQIRVVAGYHGPEGKVEDTEKEKEKFITKWEFSAIDIENEKPIDIIYSGRRNEDQVLIRFKRGAQMLADNNSPDAKAKHSKWNKKEDVIVIFPFMKSGHYKSIVITAKAWIQANSLSSEGWKRPPDFEYKFYNLDTGDLDFDQEIHLYKWSWSPKRIRRLLEWLKEKGYNISAEELKADWSFDSKKTNNDEPETINVRAQRARILRLYGRKALVDGYLSDADIIILRTLAEAYAKTDNHEVRFRVR